MTALDIDEKALAQIISECQDVPEVLEKTADALWKHKTMAKRDYDRDMTIQYICVALQRAAKELKERIAQGT